MEHISTILVLVMTDIERRAPACHRCGRRGEIQKEAVLGREEAVYYCTECRVRLTYNGRLYQPRDGVRFEELEPVGGVAP